MNEPETNLDLITAIRQQFDQSPYPRIPLEQTPYDQPYNLSIHNLVTPYYLRNRRYLATEGKIILDAGCGSGYKSLVLAAANPGATIIGIDISEASIKLAQQRLQYHGFTNTEFYPLSIEELPKLGKQFDYINCDDVLYLLPNPVLGLQSLKSVLKPYGIIRANLHSYWQRLNYYRAQELCQMMGLMAEPSQDTAIELVRETMRALKDNVRLKTQTWNAQCETDPERVMANHLLRGDRGYRIPELFTMLRAADLEFISMINWREWNLLDLFTEPDNLPLFWGITLSETTLEERLHLFELLHPIHRLFDFWCGHLNQTNSHLPIEEWTLDNWQSAWVYLHPQLINDSVSADLIRAISESQLWEISRHLPLHGEARTLIDSNIAACLLILLDSGQLFSALVNKWQQLHPFNPITGQSTTNTEATTMMIRVLTWLEAQGYVLLESQV